MRNIDRFIRVFLFLVVLTQLHATSSCAGQMSGQQSGIEQDTANADDALELLHGDAAILFMGANWCPWCRNAIPVMLDAARDLRVKKIFYLDITKERDGIGILDGELITITEGTQEYFDLLRRLDPFLDEYWVTDDLGNRYDTNEKRILVPFIIAIKNQEVYSANLCVFDLEEGQSKYDVLTATQYDRLYQYFHRLFLAVLPE